MTSGASDICWASRVPKRKIRRLYESEATGLLDDEFTDDVGISLYLRCQSILAVGQAQEGKVRCPRCHNSGRDTVINRHSHAREEILKCPQCAWQITWGEYLKTYQGKQLSQGGAGGYFLAFMRAYERAQTPKEKMSAIDRLVHEFHYNTLNNRRQPTRAACVNLIAGKLRDVVAFLNELSYGEATAPELKDTKTRWTDTLYSMSKWHPK